VAPEKNITAPAPALPGSTLVIALVASVVFFEPVFSGWLIYDRARLLHGEIWRAWTGHLVHFGSSHLLWNLAIFLAAGCWIERLRPRSTRWFYVICAPVIAASLLILEPDLARYAGLSGVATGVLVFLGCVKLDSHSAEPTWFWVAVFGLVVVKIALETVTHTPLLVEDFSGIVVVPLAHISGAVCGIATWFVTRTPLNAAPPPPS
jgi:rhomboid family GlyGly-CTERM serine protease